MGFSLGQQVHSRSEPRRILEHIGKASNFRCRPRMGKRLHEQGARHKHILSRLRRGRLTGVVDLHLWVVGRKPWRGL